MIILLGLQIFKVANQLINSSVDSELGLHSFPIPIFDSLLNYNPLSSINNESRLFRVNNISNESYFPNKLNSGKKSNEFSKRIGFFESPNNQSLPFESNIRKYSKHKVIPKPISKPYPYSRGFTNGEQTPYSDPNTESDPQRKFSSDNNEPDWNEFEDSIDQSLNEPKRYYQKEPQLKSEKKRDEDSNPPTEDSLDNEQEYPPDLQQTDTTDGYDSDEEDPEEEEEEEDTDSSKYREEETPECAYGHSYCILDDQYPEESMRKAVDKQMDILTQILPESTETFDLVEGISKEIDENYTYIDSPHDLYNSESSEDISYGNQNELNYRDGGYICPSYVNYIKPKRAQNNDGLWKVILNLNESYRGVEYNQHIRIEECVYEKTKCNFAPNYYKSECIQKYSNERLLAWAPDKGIHLDVFRLPIACSCHLILNQ